MSSDLLLYPSPPHPPDPRSPSPIVLRRRTRLQASPSSSLFRNPWTALKRNSSFCRLSITGACPAVPGKWSVARAARCPWLSSLVEAAATSVLSTGVQAVACGVTVKACHSCYPLSWLFQGSPFSCLLLPLFPFYPFASVPGSLFRSCMRTINICTSFIYFATG